MPRSRRPTQELDSGLSSVQTAVAGATTQVAELEAKAKEMAGFTKTLSSGFELHGATDGVESKLIAFIEDTSQPIDKNHLVHLRPADVPDRLGRARHGAVAASRSLTSPRS